MRHLAAPLVSAVVTTGLFLFMASLIRTPTVSPLLPKPPVGLDVVHSVAPPEPVKPKPRPEPKPELGARPSPIAKVDTVDDPRATRLQVPAEPVRIPGDGVEMTPVWDRPEPGERGPSVLSSASQALPLLRRDPVYPPAALRAGIEGWVELEYAIAPDGSVTEIRVLDAAPRRVFDQAAQRALAAWKFRPGDGQGLRRGLRVRLHFRLERGQ